MSKALPGIEADAVTATAFVALYGTFIRPFTHKQRTLRKQRKEDRWLLHGTPGVANLIAPTPSAAQRFASLEQGQTELKEVVESVQSDIAKLLESHGALYDILRETNNRILAVDKKVSPNGGTTNSIGDLARRQAEKDGTWLDDPEVH